MSWFLCCVPSWFLSRPFELILSFCTQLTTFNTISPHVCIVYPTDSFQDHLPQIYHCVPSWLLSRPFDPIFIIVYLVYSFQDHMTSISLKSAALFTENHCTFHWKQQKQLIQHISLILTWCFVEYRGKAN